MNSRLVIVLAGLIIAVAGCGAASSSTPTLAPAPTATATATTAPPSGPAHTTTGQLPAELAGTFAVHLDLIDVGAADEAGDWFLALDPGTGYEFGRVSVGTPENAGDLSVDGAKISFSNETGEGACPPAPGTYSWSVAGDGSSLTLTAVSDACGVRAEQNTAHPYAKCPGEPETCADILKSTPRPVRY